MKPISAFRFLVLLQFLQVSLKIFISRTLFQVILLVCLWSDFSSGFTLSCLQVLFAERECRAFCESLLLKFFHHFSQANQNRFKPEDFWSASIKHNCYGL